MNKQRILIVMAAVIILLLLLLLYLLWDKGKTGGSPQVNYDLPTLGGDGDGEDVVVIDDPGLWEQVPELLTTPAELPEIPR